ncbi:PKD domain-containing protein, partial [Solitalea sp. MAHUQ-68]
DDESPAQVITIYPNPVAAFTKPSSCGAAGDVFTDGSSVSGGYSLTYAWDLGEGFTSTLQNPAVPAYTTAGPKTITLTVTSSGNGCKDTFTDVYQYNGATPVASFTASATTVCQDGTVTLDATGSTTGVSPIKDYIWEFSEGGTVINTISAANQAVVSINFPAITSSHTYDVKLTVRTQDGCESSTAPQSITVHPVATTTLAVGVPEICIDGGLVDITSSVTNGVAVAAPVYTTNAPAGSITAAGKFDPAVAGVGTWTITYVATATDGSCPSVAATATIVVHPLPTPTITPSATAEC